LFLCALDPRAELVDQPIQQVERIVGRAGLQVVDGCQQDRLPPARREA